MPNVELQLPAGIGEPVIVAGAEALVVAWRVVRPRFLLGGAGDGGLQIALQVLTAHGDAFWVDAAEVTASGAPVMARVFLPFMAGDLVLVGQARTPGEIRGWEITGRRLETVVTYRIHLAGTPSGEEITVALSDLALWM
jgi:hypothetical protein